MKLTMLSSASSGVVPGPAPYFAINSMLAMVRWSYVGSVVGAPAAGQVGQVLW
jgi:hypothetical protein